jgi:hypothetical protein
VSIVHAGLLIMQHILPGPREDQNTIAFTAFYLLLYSLEENHKPKECSAKKIYAKKLKQYSMFH